MYVPVLLYRCMYNTQCSYQDFLHWGPQDPQRSLKGAMGEKSGSQFLDTTNSTFSLYIVYTFYCIDTDEIPGFFLLLKNHIFITCSEDTIFIFHV